MEDDSPPAGEIRPPGATGGDSAAAAWLVLVCLAFSWLAMQAVHEVGHVLGAWLTGATVEQVVLHPLSFSRTILSENPSPLAVCWSGAVIGCLIPLAVWGGVRTLAEAWSFLPRFLLGFCLIANGLYLGTGPLTRGGDPGDLLMLGAPTWQLISFGVVATGAGLWSWNGIGSSFGFGDADRAPDRRAAIAVTVALIVLVGGELLLTPS